MRALIDGDILLYRVGFTTESETEEIAQYRMDELLHRILDTVKATEYVIYLSCGRADSFRAKLNPEYKANRKQPKPLHYTFLKDYLLSKWNAVQAVEEEADDLIGIEQAKDPNTVACTIDKDILYGVPGQKYNFVKEQMFYTLPEEATLFFYKQLLMGDKADNIFGITGVGEAKATKALEDYQFEDEEILFKVVQSAYRNWLMNEWADQYEDWGDFQEKQMNNLILLSGIQLKIRSFEGEVWKFPIDLPAETSPVLGEAVD
jgi:5'-3' exonuclease